MKTTNNILDSSVVDVLKNNQLAIFKSDTIYGIFASALSLRAYQNLIKVRPKSAGKYYIVLISGKQDALSLGISEDDFNRVSSLWPGSVTVLLKTNNNKYAHLTNSDGQIGIRLPGDKNLRKLLSLTGPLLAPSANPEGQIPASNIEQAQSYFSDSVQLYVDSGEVSLNQPPSTVIDIDANLNLSLVREGAVDFHFIKNKLKLKRPYKKRKLHKFSLFEDSKLCFEASEFKFSEATNNFSEINLEVGAGTGDLSFGLAKKYPNQLFIATDVKADRLVQGATKAQKQGLVNLIFLRINMSSLLNLIPAKSLSNIWITFPDPMPKDRQEKHRLVNQHFLKIYKELLKQGGEILFKTDDKPLFDYGLECIGNSAGQIDALSFDLHQSNLPEDYKITTVYERKFINGGKPINFIKFRL
ncbi:MAG TPA: tRNA (guanosine(46)-N7)-methyltransferase TrmB [Candidatus Saccharibacteria bacterium]|jgi:tRNA (guanine-N7-)-methyltransferase|nr:tRNA (guanosine(46)-N7)-methyltransferase TrmB [Candidatus Saccharibacteria bacterium]